MSKANGRNQSPDQKECGLHVVTDADGTTRLARASAKANASEGSVK